MHRTNILCEHGDLQNRHFLIRYSLLLGLGAGLSAMEKSTTSNEVSVHPIKINAVKIKALIFFFIFSPRVIIILMESK